MLLTILLIKFLKLTFLILLKYYAIKIIFKIMLKKLMLRFNNNNNLKALTKLFFYSIKYLNKNFYLAFYINCLKSSFICFIIL